MLTCTCVRISCNKFLLCFLIQHFYFVSATYSKISISMYLEVQELINVFLCSTVQKNPHETLSLPSMIIHQNVNRLK